MRKPNIILIMTDQQRWDCLSSVPGGWGTTPNLDRLAAEGVAFDQCYCTAPSCVPSRASFFNLAWPRQLGTMKNGDRWEHSWVEHLQAAGYRTLNVGKMHTQPFDAPCGFDQRFIVENKDGRFGSPSFYDDWEKHLRQRGVEFPTRHTYRLRPDYPAALGAYEWELEEELHWDPFVGRNADWVIRDHGGKKPLFLQIGFPGPHAPYDPPKHYIDRIDPATIPPAIPYDSADEIPPHRRYRHEMMTKNHDAIQWAEHPDAKAVQRLRRFYAANMLMIDDQIGRILDALRDTGRLDNSIILFTSDHGDCLGDHGQIQKWTMFDGVTRVPAIVWAPGKLPQGKRCDALLQQMDLVPMIFELAGVKLPDAGESVSALAALADPDAGRDCVFAEHGSCNMLPEIETMVMARERGWKCVAYAGRGYGELYDLVNDPHETVNRWDDPACGSVRQRMLERVAGHETRVRQTRHAAGEQA